MSSASSTSPGSNVAVTSPLPHGEAAGSEAGDNSAAKANVTVDEHGNGAAVNARDESSLSSSDSSSGKEPDTMTEWANEAAPTWYMNGAGIPLRLEDSNREVTIAFNRQGAHCVDLVQVAMLALQTTTTIAKKYINFFTGWMELQEVYKVFSPVPSEQTIRVSGEEQSRKTIVSTTTIAVLALFMWRKQKKMMEIFEPTMNALEKQWYKDMPKKNIRQARTKLLQEHSLAYWLLLGQMKELSEQDVQVKADTMFLSHFSEGKELAHSKFESFEMKNYLGPNLLRSHLFPDIYPYKKVIRAAAVQPNDGASPLETILNKHRTGTSEMIASIIVDDMIDFVEEKVKFQTRAIRTVCEALLVLSTTSNVDFQRPVVIHMPGTSGTGKSTLVKRLAVLMGVTQGNGYVQLNGNQLTNEIDASKINGAAPGYTGHEQPEDKLPYLLAQAALWSKERDIVKTTESNLKRTRRTEADEGGGDEAAKKNNMEQAPKGAINNVFRVPLLFMDEINQIHGALRPAMNDIMDGIITQNSETWNIKRLLVIFASNYGIEELTKLYKQPECESSEQAQVMAVSRAIVEDAMRRAGWTPFNLGRVTQVAPFKVLTTDEINEILEDKIFAYMRECFPGADVVVHFDLRQKFQRLFQQQSEKGARQVDNLIAKMVSALRAYAWLRWRDTDKLSEWDIVWLHLRASKPDHAFLTGERAKILAPPIEQGDQPDWTSESAELAVVPLPMELQLQATESNELLQRCSNKHDGTFIHYSTTVTCTFESCI